MSVTQLQKILATSLPGVETIVDPVQIAKLSLDYYHFSPILQSQLQDYRADVVVRPKAEADVIEIAKFCVQHRLPLTVRGAGTGNYGQCIPLKGGVVLDTSPMNQINWLRGGLASVQPGVKMGAFDRKARETGWEIRMAPSTYRSCTIGGFVGGGSVGMGSINYGQISDRGNLRAVKLVTMTDQPELVELRGDEVQLVTHAYGTTGIITELEIPLSPALPWTEIIVVFDEFMQAARFGQALGDSGGIVKKAVSVFASPIPAYFTALQDHLPQRKAAAFVMVSQYDLEPFYSLVEEFGGKITYNKLAAQTSKGNSLLEFTWNHTTLHARNVDPNLTYLQTFYFTLERVEQMYNHFGDEVMIHLEFLRAGGRVVPAGLQLVRYTTSERLNEIIEYHEQHGAFVANPHVYTIEDGGNKMIDPLKVEFKAKVDPYGLLNPGKMRGWEERDN